MSRRPLVLGIAVLVAGACGLLGRLTFSTTADPSGRPNLGPAEEQGVPSQPERRRVTPATAPERAVEPEPAPDAPQSEPSAVVLVVRVAVAGGGPVAGADVRVTGWGARIGGSRRHPLELGSGRSGSNGVCRISSPYPAQLLVLARHGELAGCTGGVVVSGWTEREVGVALGPARRVEGRVLDQTGRIVPGGVVTATFRRARLALHHHVESTSADDEGRYAFGPIPEELVAGVVELTTPATDRTLANGRTIREPTAEQDWDVAVVRTARLSARIVREDGTPAAGAALTVSVADGPGSAKLDADDDGRVDGRVPLGRVMLRASMRNDGPGFVRHARELEIDEGGVELGTLVLDDEWAPFRGIR